MALSKNSLFILFALFFAGSIHLYAQTTALDSLRQLVTSHPQKDTVRVNLLNAYGLEARKSTAEEAFKSYTESVDLARSLGYKEGEGLALLGLGFHHRFMGATTKALSYTEQALKLFREVKDTLQIIPCDYNLVAIYSRTANYETAIKAALEALTMAELINSSKWLVLTNYQIGDLYNLMGDTARSQHHLYKSLEIATAAHDNEGIHHAYGGLGWIYYSKNQLDSSLYCFEKQREFFATQHDPRGILESTLNILGVKEKQGRNKEVLDSIYFLKAQFIQLGQLGYLSGVHNVLARIHLHSGNADSALYYAFLVLNSSKRSGRVISIGSIYHIMAQAYAMKTNFKEAYKYQDMFSRFMDSVNLTDAVNSASAQRYSFDLEKKQSEISLLTKNEELVRKQNRQQKIMLTIALTGLLLLIVFSILLVRNNGARRKAYKRLEQQQAELKAAQAQLIQAEKMASLGQLTAGIAHEIQNPLNFVNNFSEVNDELISELKTELAVGNLQLAAGLANDIEHNLEKINHHGKRAEAIVKGMLEHSRQGTGQKHLTDINALSDEYLKLSYHGMRAKDKSFNATIKTEFDSSIGQTNIVAQDIGRVLLNLYNNAFYAVNEKIKLKNEKYEPTVILRTKKQRDRVQIIVEDNGNGIPEPIVDKIFQPFFTTKPTGQGTGLGLSLAYDIIKAHGGNIQVNTKQAEGSEFIILLPV